MDKLFCIYIMTNEKRGVIYIGVTSNLIERAWKHKNKTIKGFTSKYNLDKLVYYEIVDNAEYAIKREKQLKNWKRKWKIDLIERNNPEWNDLYDEISGR